jgi:hypothetical protein
MDYIKQLEELVKTDILIEVNQNIKELEEQYSKKANKTLKEEIDYMKQVKLYFDEVIMDIDNKTISQEQALDILEGLEDMKMENQEL